jgi:Domain of unknown function (DUF4124)
MRKALVLVTSLVFAGAAAGQHKWVDQNGRIQYGDTPPPGASVTTVRPPSAPAAEPEAKKGTRSGPAALAERDAEFRKRQQEAEQEREKQAKAHDDASVKRENCARARENLRLLEGGRVARMDAKGERHFLNDAQLAQETVKARRDAQEFCS